MIFDSYEKEDGIRKSEYGRYGRYGRLKLDGSANISEDREGFEHVIRYKDGIKSDFDLASCSVPVNYDYTKLNVETRTMIMDQHDDDNKNVGDKNNALSSYGMNEMRYFWDGGLFSCMFTAFTSTFFIYMYLVYIYRVHKAALLLSS